MKSISASLEAHLLGEVTTLTSCWEIKRRDGRFYRFTDHVRNLTINNDLYRADIGYSRTAVSNSSGLSVDNLSLEGVFDDDAITEKDLRDGLFDFAEVRIFLVNYEDLTMGILRLRRGTLGEVQTRSVGQFVAELRGMAQRMQQIIGNLYQPTCRAQLGGKKRCKFPVDPPAVLRNAAYQAGDFVKAYTGNATSTLLSVPVADGDFEALTGWTTVSGTPQIVATQDGLAPAEGSNFLASATSSFEIMQEVDLTAIVGFVGADLDAGFYVFQSSIRRATSDLGRFPGRVRVEAVSDTGEILAELWNTGYEVISPGGAWVIRSIDSVVMPVGTRALRFYVAAGSQTNLTSKAVFDDLQAEIIDADSQTGIYQFYENVIYECTSAGVSAGASPVFDTTPGNTTADGTVTWTAREAFTRSAVVSSVTDNSDFVVTMTTSAAGSVDDYFNGGEVVWESGNNIDLPMEVRDYTHGSKRLNLFLAMPNNIQVGDRLRVTPGCNRTRSNCRDKFRIAGSLNLANGNMKEYDGEPDVPGPDAVLTYPGAT